MDNLIYLLIPIICTLFVLFFIEKKRTKSQLKAHKNLLDANIAEVSNLVTSVTKQDDKFSRELQQTNLDAEKTYTKLENLIYSTRYQVDKTQKENNNSLKEYTEDKVNQSFSDMNARLLSLVEIIEQINTENKKLKKKIEFFSEIESDSKELNETEDTNAREALIQQALREISKPKDYSEQEKKDIVVENKEKSFENISVRPFESEEVIKETDKKHSISEQGILDEEQSQALFKMEKQEQEKAFYLKYLKGQPRKRLLS
jgi:hypothetical protein